MNHDRRCKLAVETKRMQTISTHLITIFNAEMEAVAKTPDGLQVTDRYKSGELSASLIAEANAYLLDAIAIMQEIEQQPKI